MPTTRRIWCRADSSPPAVAYSYLRFSLPQQAKGDSVRRQTELRDAWIARNHATLDTTLSLLDDGMSTIVAATVKTPTGTHWPHSSRGLVKTNRIQRGSYLIVESLDRLSREHIDRITLLLNLIEAGIRVVQLLPVEAIYDESVEPMQLLMAIMELSRGHSESKMKSDRVGGAWPKRSGLRPKTERS